MFEEALWRLLHRWRQLSAAHAWIRLVVPAVLMLDMVHNMYVVTAEWRKRVQGWRAEDERRLSGAVEAVLRHVSGHCATADEQLWPPAILELLRLPARPAGAQPQPPKAAAEDHAGADLLSWLVQQPHAGTACVEDAEPAACAAPQPAVPAQQPAPAARVRWPWQQQLDRAAALLQLTRALAEAQLQRLHAVLPLAPSPGPARAAGRPEAAELDGWQRLEGPPPQEASAASGGGAALAGTQGLLLGQRWANRLAGSAQARLDAACAAMQKRCPLPPAHVTRRSALRFRVRWHGIPRPAPRPLELDLSGM